MDWLQIIAESLPELFAIGGSVVLGWLRFRRADDKLDRRLEGMTTAISANTAAMTAHLREHQAGIPTPRSDHLTPVEGNPRGRD